MSNKEGGLFGPPSLFYLEYKADMSARLVLRTNLIKVMTKPEICSYLQSVM
jgi:hypothetical protein